MNEKIQLILFKIVLDLKKLGWKSMPDWEITFKSEGHISMTKVIPVKIDVNGRRSSDSVETYLNFKFSSDDQITFYPEYNVSTSIFINSEIKDISENMDIDIPFSEEDLQDLQKINAASVRINDSIQNYIQESYQNNP